MTFAELLGDQLSETLCCTGAVPDPLTAIAIGEAVALLANARLAATLPDALGVNVTVNALLVPAEIVNGKLTPLTVNSGSEVPMEETVTELPDALRLAVWLVLVPTTTEPKLTEPGATDNWPCVASLPDSGMLTVELLAFDRTLRLPEALPAVVGVNVTLNV